MKVGDLVSVPPPTEGDPDWVGIIIAIPKDRQGFFPRAVVYWNAQFPKEVEHQSHLEVISAQH